MMLWLCKATHLLLNLRSLSELISGEHEDQALQRILMLMNCSELWQDSLADEHKTVANQELDFRTMASAGSQIHSKLKSFRGRQPLLTFRVDLNPEIEETIVGETCEDMHTAWSKAHNLCTLR